MLGNIRSKEILYTEMKVNLNFGFANGILFHPVRIWIELSPFYWLTDDYQFVCLCTYTYICSTD